MVTLPTNSRHGQSLFTDGSMVYELGRAGGGLKARCRPVGLERAQYLGILRRHRLGPAPRGSGVGCTNSIRAPAPSFSGKCSSQRYREQVAALAAAYAHRSYQPVCQVCKPKVARWRITPATIETLVGAPCA